MRTSSKDLIHKGFTNEFLKNTINLWSERGPERKKIRNHTNTQKMYIVKLAVKVSSKYPNRYKNNGDFGNWIIP
jgi:hypothetical protein